ncbi:MAG: transglutaminase-like cysteine peptidase [Aquabacterium sp.]|uniref:transglutaminase-like cysteine peptidase n=1 Tax=Aquabacterium sp. TaxID=1872578 RepID=UPI00272095AE|nr:transglutaminase-like cysteine peptidase [Aquabacterium sp.]MDO9004531.1 transglutaminase-like cysteine peptidase [Aquabacterium sp.]
MSLARAALTLPLKGGWPGRGVASTFGAWLVRWMVVGSLLIGPVGSAFESQKIMSAAQRMGPSTANQAQALIQEVAEAASSDEASRLKRINSFFNRRVEYRDDRDVWGQVDYWATPLEMLNKGAGDCEDYAIGKYLSLIAAGVPAAKMRLVYVRAELGGAILAHMVLAYYPEPLAEPLILDNLITDIRPASRRPDLAPVFSFNAEGLWQGVGSTTAGDPVARLSRWREVLTKTRAEGWW